MKIDREKLVKVIEERGIRVPQGIHAKFEFGHIQFIMGSMDRIWVSTDEIDIDLNENSEFVFDCGDVREINYAKLCEIQSVFESVHEACGKLGVTL